jgi:hypothetical protein
MILPIILVISRFMRGIHGYPVCDGRMDTPDKPGYDGFQRILRQRLNIKGSEP